MRRSDEVGLFPVIFFIILLVAPLCALLSFSDIIAWQVLIGAPIAVSVFTYFAYDNDKHRAIAGQWRISELTLHLAELLGGWPGAFIAQRMYRHKITKISYQCTFWCIVMLHELVALDSLAGWVLLTRVLDFV